MSTHRPLRPGPVVCVGETMAALAPDPLGPLDGADLLRVDIAGAESNVALYLADHGIPARWVSAVGDDPFGRRVRARIAAGGVDGDHWVKLQRAQAAAEKLGASTVVVHPPFRW
ncbi:PfkB family carbohydrate kinase, partial [Streptomyces mirabilis]|uniref:PfkB family carbohydrate kinase n=1 Tax=Streptomyces mirabilis TaxID=68239 RepID=UPI0033332376